MFKFLDSKLEDKRYPKWMINVVPADISYLAMQDRLHPNFYGVSSTGHLTVPLLETAHHNHLILFYFRTTVSLDIQS
jgi:hypothetical protein